MAKTHPSYTIDTTFTAKNITTALSVYTFTAAASAKVQFIVKLTNAESLPWGMERILIRVQPMGGNKR
jgi:hypothetical protein